jgi:hypothetical protein
MVSYIVARRPSSHWTCYAQDFARDNGTFFKDVCDEKKLLNIFFQHTYSYKCHGFNLIKLLGAYLGA